MTVPTELDPLALTMIRQAIADEVARQLGPALREIFGTPREREREDVHELDEAIQSGEIRVLGDGPRLRLVASPIEEDLEELNRLAREELRDESKHPKPLDCPQPGTWVRLVNVTGSAPADPVGVWHVVREWEPTWGRLRTRCGHPRNVWPKAGHQRLLTSVARPRQAVCRKCFDLAEAATS